MKLEKKIICFLLVVYILMFFPQLGKAQTAKGTETTIRVLTFNILHGATVNGDFKFDVIADVINSTKPDLVALQEVDYKTNRAKKYDLVLELAYRTEMIPLFGRAMYFDSGEYGEAILSKTTIINSRVVPLPYLKGHEPRTALEITTVIGNSDTISFIGTHLDHVEDDTNRLMQANEINEVFLSNKYPTILAGDLNATPDSRVINLLERMWKSSYNPNNYEYTFPSNNPSIKIDYIMYKPKNSFTVMKTEVIQDTIASDHCAYLIVLKLK